MCADCYGVELVIDVLFFGPAKDAAGDARIALEAQNRASIGNVRELLAARSEDLKQLLKTARIARNREFVNDDMVVEEGDEIAVIPPVSGG